MLLDALRRLEQRCRVEAPELLDDVRALTALAAPKRLAASLLGDTIALGSLDDGPLEPADPPAVPIAAVSERYVDLGVIGRGGMGAVHRVRDLELNRVVAMKRLLTDRDLSPAEVARFVEEVQTTAQLQHPNIVPVYDAGRLVDGEVYFTMKEVRGRTLGEVIREVHVASAERWAAAPSGWTFRRLVAALHQASLAVAYAHERGVVHRDLKPENVMLGAFGEVQVMDWGLCKVTGREETATEQVIVERSREATRAGRVMGTPAYMAPEQAFGEVERIDARTDVYALGAVLYEVLSGRPPYTGRTGAEIVWRVVEGPPPPPRRAGPLPEGSPSLATGAQDSDDHLAPGPGDDLPLPVGAVELELPEELVAACLRAMSREPADRYATATDFADALQSWLDGSKRREQGLEIVARAEATLPAAAALRARAAALRAEAAEELAKIPPSAPEDEKLSGWAKEDEASALAARAALEVFAREQLLAGALTLVPELAEARAVSAEDELDRHAAAEAARDELAATRSEILLRGHLAALPEAHPVRRAGARYLRGRGAVTLVTDPPGATVHLWRYEPHGRRLVARPVRSLGRTPLIESPLEMGSYLLEVRRPDASPDDPPVRYPVHIGRGAHWDGVRPGAREPLPIALPAPGELGPDDCYVPAGWFQAGSGVDYAALPAGTRLWCDPFVMRRFQVTNRQYVAFLDDLVASGREDEALAHAPRVAGGRFDQPGELVYGRDDAGRFVLRPDGDGDLWAHDWPVVLVDFASASAYAGWWAARTGRPWRLPWELEWEKAARGVDGRFRPWGDGFDPSFCNMRDSSGGRPQLAEVDTFPVDESPYGVRGLGGNVLDWCEDVWASPLPLREAVVAPHVDGAAQEELVRRVHRGGHWAGRAGGVKAAARLETNARARLEILGFRLARGYGPPS